MACVLNVRSYIVSAALAATGWNCTDGNDYAQAICAMVDTSGTYVDELAVVSTTVRRALIPRMLPGDSLILVRIDSESYDEENVEGVLTLDTRPSMANHQKAKFAARLEALAATRRRSRHTDIRGAMMLCSEYLGETGAGDKVIVSFSDMQEELRRGANRDLAADELTGIRVAAMNVKRLGADKNAPALYRDRLSAWENRVAQSGASDWSVILEPARLVEYLDERP